MTAAVMVRALPLALAALLTSSPLAGQACLGRAVGGLAGSAIVGNAAYVDHDLAWAEAGREFGATFWGNPAGVLAFSAGYTRRTLDDGPSLDVLQGRLAMELPPVRHLPPGGGACLTAGAGGAWLSGDQDIDLGHAAYSFPIGFAAGLTVPAGRLARLHPFIHPQLVFTLTDGALFGFETRERAVTLNLEGGSGFARGPFVARFRLLGAIRPHEAGLTPIPDLRAGLEAGFRF